MFEKLAKGLRVALAEEFRRIHGRLDIISQRVEARSDELLEKLSPNFPAGTLADYAAFWDAQAQTRGGAATGVAGRPFGLEAWDELIGLHGEPIARMIAGLLAIAPNHDVLEVGVGVGRLARHIAPLCGRFVGADISGRMLGDASRRLGSTFPNITLHKLERPYLQDFPDATFDRIYFQVVLVHLDAEDVYNYIREAARVLKPGGRAYFQHYNLLAPGGWAILEAAAAPLAAGAAPVRGRAQAMTAAALRRMVDNAGLAIVEEKSRLGDGEQRYSELSDPAYWKDYRARLAATLEARLGAGAQMEGALKRFEEDRLEGAPDREWAHYLIAVAQKR